MTRQEMMMQLNITDDSPYTEVQEKLFLLAILAEGTEVTARVLKRQMEYRKIFWNLYKEVTNESQ